VCAVITSSNNYQNKGTITQEIGLLPRQNLSLLERKTRTKFLFRDSYWQTPRPQPLTYLATPRPRQKSSSLTLLRSSSLLWYWSYLFCATEIFIIVVTLLFLQWNLHLDHGYYFIIEMFTLSSTESWLSSLSLCRDNDWLHLQVCWEYIS